MVLYAILLGVRGMKSLRVGEVEITWLKHAGFKIVGGGVTVYIDPYGVKEKDEVDFVFVTHEHYDHCDMPSLRVLASERTTIVGPKAVMKKVAGLPGGKLEVTAGQRYELGSITVEVIPAYNVLKSFHPIDAGGVGYVLTIGGVRIYHAGDTDHISEMSKLKEIDVALLPVSGIYVMDAKEASDSVKAIKPRIAIPMHYGDIVGSKHDALQFKELAGEITQVEILEPAL
jgi:L-ascorbate metabolism protein UlaG (beta-lactamase superfamily)